MGEASADILVRDSVALADQGGGIVPFPPVGECALPSCPGPVTLLVSNLQDPLCMAPALGWELDRREEQ